MDTKKGVGFAGLLTILFIGLKLAGIITWSWFWVLSPLLADIAIVLIILCILRFIIWLKD